jgi:glutamine amidotransferase
MSSVVVVDYGMGNLRSVERALSIAAPSFSVKVSGDPRDIENADRIVFPGQGAMPDCMRELAKRDLIDSLRAAAAVKPFLGICIGLQMLFEHSEEGDVDGLGLLAGSVKKFVLKRTSSDETRFKIPHMGWNTVQILRDHPIFHGIGDGEYFYFVHSYFVKPSNGDLIVGKTDYSESFVSAVGNKNLVAVQFHPEKSQTFGLKMLKNFMHWHIS